MLSIFYQISLFSARYVQTFSISEKLNHVQTLFFVTIVSLTFEKQKLTICFVSRETSCLSCFLKTFLLDSKQVQPNFCM